MRTAEQVKVLDEIEANASEFEINPKEDATYRQMAANIDLDGQKNYDADDDIEMEGGQANVEEEIVQSETDSISDICLNNKSEVKRFLEKKNSESENTIDKQNFKKRYEELMNQPQKTKPLPSSDHSSANASCTTTTTTQINTKQTLPNVPLSLPNLNMHNLTSAEESESDKSDFDLLQHRAPTVSKLDKKIKEYKDAVRQNPLNEENQNVVKHVIYRQLILNKHFLSPAFLLSGRVSMVVYWCCVWKCLNDV